MNKISICSLYLLSSNNQSGTHYFNLFIINNNFAEYSIFKNANILTVNVDIDYV